MDKGVILGPKMPQISLFKEKALPCAYNIYEQYMNGDINLCDNKILLSFSSKIIQGHYRPNNARSGPKCLKIPVIWQ